MISFQEFSKQKPPPELGRWFSHFIQNVTYWRGAPPGPPGPPWRCIAINALSFAC